ncbi:MAG: lmo0937 family membrane protein [Sedimentisphaerales bacterium]|nr:lmo0937 family membrane protein [Sedimentisphaerales bacterium]
MGSAKKEMTMEGAPTGGELMANRKQNHMWWTVAVILIILWLPGLLGGYTVTGVANILLSLALVVVLFRILQGRRPA